MSIFSSKKAKPREIDADRSKQRTAATNGSGAQANGPGLRNGTAAISNAALSAGARTIQRAQIMAASRKRMNSETPDYSIEGAAKTNGTAHKAGAPNSVPVSAARLAAQGVKSNGTNGIVEAKNRTATMPNKLSKTQPGNSEKKIRASSISNLNQTGPATPIYAALSTTNPPTTTQKPNGIINSDNTSNSNLAVHKTPPLPMDSPTLGYDGNFTKPPPRSTPGSGLATPVSNSNSHTPSGSDVAQDMRIGRLSRNDSGLVSKFNTNKEASYDSKTSKSSNNAEKPAGVHPGVRAESKASNRSSRSSTYVSKLDPGPTHSPFAEPVEASKASPTQPISDDTNKRPRQTSRPQKFQLPESEMRKEARGGGAADKTRSPIDSPPPKESSSKGLTRIVAASQAPHISQMRTSAPQPQREEKPFSQSPASSTPPTSSRGIEPPQEAAPKTYNLPIVSPLENPGAFRTAPTSKSNTPPQSSDSKDRSAPSSDSMHVSKAAESYFSKSQGVVQEVPPAVMINPGLPQPATTRSSISEPRPALPPVSVLEGFKVNKRGHVLDEEGEVIGELFEGDLIDCVRQKVDANGDVLDESGVPVGRARTIVKGTIMAPRWSISSGVSLPLSTYNWGRRDSTASQQTHQTHQTQQSQTTFFNRGVAVPVAPPAVEGNAVVAELDASTEAEASPLVDQSEIFSPFGVPKPPGSSSTTNSRPELAAEERRNSGSSKPEARRGSVTPNSASNKPESRRESVSAEPPPMPKPVRKWTSRYFESNPLDPQQALRRNSASADMVASPTSIASPTGIASPKTTSIYGAVSPTRSRAVIGPTLESLLEQDPSLFSSSPAKQFGGSTPNLPLEVAQTGPTATRRASTQFGAPAPGLAGSRLSVKGAYQPSKRSPLASYETTPPGSGGGPPEDDQARARSLPPATRRTQNNRGKASMESDLAAPAPEISKTKWQQRRALLAAEDADRTAEKRKSRFSFNFGRRDSTLVKSELQT